MSPTYLFNLLIVLIASTQVLGDLYLQNPRGNNDRLNEAGDRTNDKRLFDSQNNARGGYCTGTTPALPAEMKFYENSVLSVEWTAQHSCGNDNTRCNFVIQYMCSDDSETADQSLVIRDGTVTNTIPSDQTYNTKTGTGAGAAYQFGMNEPLAYYQQCVARERNKGLFNADQNLNGATKDAQGATITRQNTNGARYGFECPEESEYYPYWHPSPWKDVAVLTNQDDCELYQSQSQNVLAKSFCQVATLPAAGATRVPNNERQCTQAGGKWTQAAAYDIPAPACLKAPVGRDNHLGNGDAGATTNSFNWTLPSGATEKCVNEGSCACVMRMRYNITVGEVTANLDSLNNTAANSPVTNDPTVTVDGNEFQLALDTQQTGRTFQDRSFMFRIIPRAGTDIPASAKVYNLNVRGKRGNIVQTYPATEYDFVPTHLEVAKDDFVHYQWTGCDTNPNGNAGEGRTSTDRSNIVQIASMTSNYPLTDAELKTANKLFTDDATRADMANIGQTGCLNSTQLTAKYPNDANGREQDQQNCAKLNAAKSPYYDGGAVKMSNLGTFYYMSSRNNNFSNRSQKASITVSEDVATWKIAVGVVAGVAAVAVGAAAGTIFYAKRNPHSRVAEFVHKVPGLSKI